MGTLLQLLSVLRTVDAQEIKTLITEVGQIGDAIEQLKIPGNTKQDIIKLLDEIADGLKAVTAILK